jgi:hypothetical protein
MQQSCEFKGMSHFCCFIALLPVLPFIATPFLHVLVQKANQAVFTINGYLRIQDEFCPFLHHFCLFQSISVHYCGRIQILNKSHDSEFFSVVILLRKISLTIPNLEIFPKKKSHNSESGKIDKSHNSENKIQKSHNSESLKTRQRLFVAQRRFMYFIDLATNLLPILICSHNTPANRQICFLNFLC